MISDDVFKLKKLADELTYTGDDLVFDKLLGEIDSVIFRLRTACFVPHPPPVDTFMRSNSEKKVDWDSLLSDISAGITTQEGKSESEDHTAINSDIDF